MIGLLIGSLIAGAVSAVAVGASAASQAAANQRQAEYQQEQAEAQAEAAAEQAAVQARIAKQNAKRLEKQAEGVMETAGWMTEDIRERGEQVKGSQRAFIGKAGVEFSGSSKDIYTETEEKISEDIRRTMKSAKDRRDYLLSEAETMRETGQSFEVQEDYYNEAGESATEYWSEFSEANDPVLAGFATAGLSFLGSATSSLLNFGAGGGFARPQSTWKPTTQGYGQNMP